MDVSAVLSSPTILEAAWLRVRTWYHRGEWVPQPEFARWELDADVMLEELGKALASRSYAPSPMLLLPHAKKKGRLRHYCQPSVRDQVAFTVFGVLLAPLFEERMHSFSFGNRWYRGLTRREEGDASLWSPRNWSLADRSLYQPYRRAHGLFRRVASWTVDAMLGCEPTTESSLGPMAEPDDFGNDLLPVFARRSYWQSFPETDRVFWARFDLKLAFPSVRIEALRQAMKSVIADFFSDETSGTIDLRLLLLSENLRLFDGSIRQHLMECSNVDLLVDYLCDLMEQVRYLPFESSDQLFFPNDSKSPNPKLLPLGDGSKHPGLPTGLAVCGMLFNVYLQSIDNAMADWFTPRPWISTPGQPAAFLRFADDMVLLAGSSSVLVDGIGRLMNAIESQKSSSDLNLRMNWDKAQPQRVADLLTKYRKLPKRSKPSLAEWVQENENGQSFIPKLEREAITKETRGQFVTELVERLSDLGAEKQIDLLPGQAKVRLARLQEIVHFKPDDSVVPRETQLVFAANHLVRAWLPEEDRQQDASLLAEIRRSVGEALREASDKPRLWRAVWRIAIRRPTSAEDVSEELLQREDDSAKKWLLSVVGRFSETAPAERFVPPGVDFETEPNLWNAVWPMFSSFQRAAIWRAFASVARDVHHHATRLVEEKAFAPPHSWLFRSSDEQTLQRLVGWLSSTAHECLLKLYDGSERPLPVWESESLAIAFMAMMPRSAVVHDMPAKPVSFSSVVAGLVQRHRPEWSPLGSRLRTSDMPNSPTSVFELLMLATGSGSDESEAAQTLAAATMSPRDLLRVMNATHWRLHVVDDLRRAAQQELSEHSQRLAEARAVGPAAVRRELNRYQVARQAWLASGGTR